MINLAGDTIAMYVLVELSKSELSQYHNLACQNIHGKTVGLDLFELNGSNYILVIDYQTAFVEIVKLSNITSVSIMNNLESTFALDGIPEVVFPDNGTPHKCLVRFLQLKESLKEKIVQDI